MKRGTKLLSTGENIELHSEDGWGAVLHMAVNVKLYGELEAPEETPDEVLRMAYDFTRESWWYEAARVAHEAGFSGVTSEGRSGGWCVPFFATEDGKLVGSYPDDRKNLRPVYPELGDPSDVAQFLWFQRGIETLMTSYSLQERFLREVKDITESRAEEAEEARTGFPIVDGNNYPMYYL